MSKTLSFIAASVLILYLNSLVVEVVGTCEDAEEGGDSSQRLARIYSVYTSIVLLLAALSIESFPVLQPTA